MRRQAGFVAAVLVFAGVLRCASFGSGTTTSSSTEGGAEGDASVADGPSSGISDDASTDAPTALTFYCPTEGGACVFGLEVCCVQHSTHTPFAASDVLTAECIHEGSPCVPAGGAITIVKCDHSDLCRGGSAGTASRCCISGDGSEVGCIPGSCPSEACQRTATEPQCADADAQCGPVNSAQGGLDYGACQ